MDIALQHLSRQDPVMKELIEKYGEVSMEGNYMESAGLLFIDLIRSVAGQQLSVKAASTIWERVERLIESKITPAGILTIPDEALCGAGLSAPKTRYIKGIAQAVEGGTLRLDELKELADEKVIEQLTAVKGIGRWTAEMFLIFALGRPDIFSFGDGGLRNAMAKLYGGMPSRERQAEISERWKPYRSYASLLLWRSLDNEPKILTENKK